MYSALVQQASRHLAPSNPRTHYYCRRRRGGDYCGCYFAKLPQGCQACKGRIHVGDCITKYISGWGHTECNEYEEQRGLPMIRDEYIKVHYTDDYLQLEGNKVSSPEPLLLTCTDEPQTTQESTEEDEIEGVEGTKTQIKSDQPAVVTPAKRKPTGHYGESSLKRVRCTLFPEEGSRQQEHENDTNKEHGDDETGGSDGEDFFLSEDDDEEEEEEEKTSERKETDEQCQILKYEPGEGEVIAINALAGCGKTTTISLLSNQYCENRYNRLLYLVFNKRNEKEVSKSNKFPKEKMETRTTHSCILRHYFGTEKMQNVHSGSPRHHLDYIKDQTALYAECKSVFPELEAEDQKVFERRVQTIASFIRKTVEKFQSSDSEQVEQSHVFWRATHSSSKRSEWKRKIPRQRYVQWAQTVFDESYQLCRGVKLGLIQRKVEIPFDTYLKAAELDKLVLPHNVIFIDEAQDMTPCQASLFWGAHQRRGKIIYLFGDRHQQLYRFRGASDSFDSMVEWSRPRMSLTGSFRFGHNIAAYASYTLKAIGATDLIKGRAVNPGRVQKANCVDTSKSLVVLCRSNQGIFEYLLENQPKKWTSLGFELPPEEPKPFMKNLEDFLWGRTDLFSYKREVFASACEISDYIVDEGDTNLMRYFKLLSYLKEKETSMREFFRRLRASHSPLYGKSPDDYNDGVVVSTVHKAKGLEFNNVLIYSDFKFGVIFKSKDMNKDVCNDEGNILYVAITRAKKRVFLSDEAFAFFETLKEAFGRIPELHRVPEPNDCLMSDTRREQLFLDWRTLEKSETPINSLDDIPWPPKDALGFDNEMSETAYRSYAKALILTYHPDKFQQKFGHRCCSQEV